MAVGTDRVSLRMTLQHWINDGFMAVFFFFVGFEIRRELLVGELASLKTRVSDRPGSGRHARPGAGLCGRERAGQGRRVGVLALASAGNAAGVERPSA